MYVLPRCAVVCVCMFSSDKYVSLGMFRHVAYVCSVVYVSLGMVRFVRDILFRDWYVSLGKYVLFGKLHFGMLLFYVQGWSP
jgi:hypothetical protein